jgi:hypothetical protein
MVSALTMMTMMMMMMMTMIEMIIVMMNLLMMTMMTVMMMVMIVMVIMMMIMIIMMLLLLFLIILMVLIMILMMMTVVMIMMMTMIMRMMIITMMMVAMMMMLLMMIIMMMMIMMIAMMIIIAMMMLIMMMIVMSHPLNAVDGLSLLFTHPPHLYIYPFTHRNRFFFLVFPFSVSLASSIRINKLLVNRKFVQARHSAWVSLLTGSISMLFTSILTYVLRDFIGYVFSINEDVVARMKSISIYNSAFQIVFGVYGSTQGILRATSHQLDVVWYECDDYISCDCHQFLSFLLLMLYYVLSCQLYDPSALADWLPHRDVPVLLREANLRSGGALAGHHHWNELTVPHSRATSYISRLGERIPQSRVPTAAHWNQEGRQPNPNNGRRQR